MESVKCAVGVKVLHLRGREEHETLLPLQEAIQVVVEVVVL